MSQTTEKTANQSQLLIDKWRSYNAAETQFIELRKKLIHQIMTMQIKKGVDLFSQLQEKLQRFKKSEILERITHSLITGQCVQDIHMKYVQENIHIVSNNTQKFNSNQQNVQEELNSIDNKVSEYEFENKKFVQGQKLQTQQKKQQEMKLQSKKEEQVWKQSQQAPDILEKPDQNQTQQTTNKLFTPIQEKIQIIQTMNEKQGENQNQQSPIILVHPKDLDRNLTKQTAQAIDKHSQTQQTWNDSAKQNVQLATPVSQIVQTFQENYQQKISDNVSVEGRVQNPSIKQQTALIVPSQQNNLLENKQGKNSQNNESGQQKQEGDDNNSDPKQKKKKKKNKKNKKKNNTENISQQKDEQKKDQEGYIIQPIDLIPKEQNSNLENKIQEQAEQKKQTNKEQKVETKLDEDMKIKTQSKNEPKNGKQNQQQTNTKQKNPQFQQNQPIANKNTNNKKKK